jgi:hypothetical protein
MNISKGHSEGHEDKPCMRKGAKAHCVLHQPFYANPVCSHFHLALTSATTHLAVKHYHLLHIFN